MKMLNYDEINRMVEEMEKFPFPQRDQLEQIAVKLRYLGTTTPEDALGEEAQNGLGYLLSDIAREVDAIVYDLRQDGQARLDAIKREALA